MYNEKEKKKGRDAHCSQQKRHLKERARQQANKRRSRRETEEEEEGSECTEGRRQKEKESKSIFGSFVFFCVEAKVSVSRAEARH